MVKKEQLTVTFPEGKGGIKKELLRMKDEDFLNVSAFIVKSIEEKFAKMGKLL